MKRAVIFLILFSMTLHCASRLEVLSYLYEKRHDMALTVGLISEVPIPMCNSDYDFDKGLKIQDNQTRDKAPRSFSMAQEIILFLPAQTYSIPDIDITPLKSEIHSGQCGYFSTYLLDIFHPPSFS